MENAIIIIATIIIINSIIKKIRKIKKRWEKEEYIQDVYTGEKRRGMTILVKNTSKNEKIINNVIRIEKGDAKLINVYSRDPETDDVTHYRFENVTILIDSQLPGYQK